MTTDRIRDERPPKRADARRNYDLIVATANETFAELGTDAPMDEIARRAGVGAGTLYRHFPRREALLEAVYRAEVEQLAERAYQLLEDSPPGDALNNWMRTQIDFVTEKHGFAVALKEGIDADSDTFQLCKTWLRDAAEALLTAAREAGAVREDIQPQELLLLGHGIGTATGHASPESAERMITVALQGLRP